MSEIPNSVRPPEVPSRRGGFSHVLDVTANLATIAVAILLCIVLVRVFFVHRAPSSAARSDVNPTEKGTNLKAALPGHRLG